MRHLAKVCQFVSGIARLIISIKRWFPDGTIPYSWINDTFVGTGERGFELCHNVFDAVQRGFGSDVVLSLETLSKLDDNFPTVSSN
jgi:hypothetical protein